MSQSSTGTVQRSPFVLERIRNKHSKRDPTMTLSKSLCFHTRSILRIGILKEPGCLYPPRSESNHPSHSICVPSHLLKTMRAGEVVTTSQVHCLVGANARTKPGKAPPSPNPGNSLACAQRKGVGWEQKNNSIGNNCVGRTMRLARRYASCPTGCLSTDVLSLQSTLEEHSF